MNILLENLYVGRELYSALLSPVCLKYRLTSAEMLVLLFLANNTQFDTAKDIVNKLKITKSHVSLSVHALEERGYLKCSHTGHNQRTIHLQLCDNTKEIIEDARLVQKQIQDILHRGFSEEEFSAFTGYLQRMTDNMNAYLKDSSAGKEHSHP